MLTRFILIFLFIGPMSQTQELPYQQIPDYPAEYTSGAIVARMVDGLGFRYYWATDGLTQEDLDFQPTEEGRSVLETLQHIYGMSEMIKNAPEAKPNVRPMDLEYSFEELRKMTLENLQTASTLYSSMKSGDFDAAKVIFQRGDVQSDFPYWNMLNGMLSDCIYHTGQVTMMRRMSGNPINPNISVFRGRKRE